MRASSFLALCLVVAMSLLHAGAAVPLTSTPALARSLIVPINPCLRGDTSCPSVPPPFECGTDNPGCDIKQKVAPGGLPSGGSAQEAVDTAYTLLDCCRDCRTTRGCNTFIVRLGVCYLKQRAFDQYPPFGSPGVTATCPPSVLAETLVGDIRGTDTVIGSQCSC